MARPVAGIVRMTGPEVLLEPVDDALVPALKQALAELGADDVMIVVGGVILPDDVPTLKDTGAVAVFLPGTVIAEAAQDLLRALSARVG
jgi:methylmalonyl-CoA mutase